MAITAPNQYPAGVAVTAYLTMTNTSTVNATNLYYAVPAATNYTGSNNITIQNGVGNNPCVNIAAGASCTFPAQISANSHPGSFTVTATPNGSSSQSSISKLVTKVETKLGLQSGSLELTANIGLSNVPANNNSGANGITFLYAKTVKQNANGATLVSIVGVVKSATAGTFNNINLTDANGNLLKFENLSGASTSPLAQNSVVTFLLEIPAGVNSYDFYGQTTNNGEPVDQGTAKNTINLVDDSVGILNAQPVTFNLQSGYESQVVTYTNTGLGTVSNINITLPEPLTLISNGCSGKTLASGDFCNYSLRFNPASLVSGTTTLVATYNNGQSTNNEVDSTITYTALAPQAGLAISGNSNPNFNFSSNTVQTIESSLVTLTNSGSRPLYGLAFDVPTHFTTSVSGVASPCGSTLAVGSSCNFSLIYTNGTVTPATQATAKVNYKYTGINQQEHSGSSQMTLTYQTTQAMAALSITPAAQAFGNVLNNNSATSPQQTFTVVNGGPNPASAVSLSFTESNAALFNITSSNCGSSIPANSSCTITAKFGPFASSTAAGSKAAQLTIQYKPYAGSTSTLTAKSTVTGQAVSAQSAMIDLSSAVAAGFESGNGTSETPYTVTTGNSAPTLTYTIRNSGSVPATSFYLNTAALSGKWTLSSNSCGTSEAKVTLAKGGGCSFTVRIASTADAQANNFVPSEIEANWVDEDSPAPDGQNENLAGDTVYASIIPPASSATLSLSSSTVNLNTTNVQQTIVVTNTGTADATNLTLPILSSPLYLYAGSCTSGMTLAPQASCTYTVSYTGAYSSANQAVNFGYSGGSSATVPLTINWTSGAPITYIANNGGSQTAGIYKCNLDDNGDITYCNQDTGFTGSTKSIAFATVNGIKYLYATISDQGVSKCSLDQYGIITACDNNAGAALDNATDFSEADYIIFATINNVQYAYITDTGNDNVYTCTLANTGDFASCSEPLDLSDAAGISVTYIAGMPYLYLTGDDGNNNKGILRYALNSENGQPTGTPQVVQLSNGNGYDGTGTDYQAGLGLASFNNSLYAYSGITNYTAPMYAGMETGLDTCSLNASGISTTCSTSYNTGSQSAQPYSIIFNVAPDLSPYAYFGLSNGQYGFYKCSVNQVTGQLTNCTAQSIINGGEPYSAAFTLYEQIG